MNDSRGPERLADILGRLFAARGWGRRQDRLRLEQAWKAVAGPDIALRTSPRTIRRGVLEVEVDGAALMQELASFHKRRLLEALRRQLAGNPAINDLRFKAGAGPGTDSHARKGPHP